MGPLYRTKRIQDTIHQNSSFVICSDQNESILLPVSQRRDRKPQQTGSGKVELSAFIPGSSLFQKKNGKLLLIIDLSLLNRYIKKQAFKMETVNSVRQAMRLNDLGCLHRLNRCISTRSDTSSIQEVSSLRTRRSSLSLLGLTVRNVPKSVNFFETDGRYCSVSTPTCHISFSIPRRLAHQKSDSQPTDYSDKLFKA